MDSEFSIDKIKEQAEALFSDLSLKATEFEKKIGAINEHFKNTKAENREELKSWNALKQIFSDANESVEIFKNDKQVLSRLLFEAQTFYEKKYLPLKEKIVDPEIGLLNTLNTSKQQKREIDKIGGHCKDQFIKITESVKVHSNTLKSLIDLEQKTKKIFSEITIRGDKTKEFYTEIANANRIVIKLKSEVDSNSKKSHELVKTIEKLLVVSNTQFDQITEIKSKSENTYRDILTLYEIAADTGRSGEFDRRRKSLTLELKKWEIHLFYTTILLFVFVVTLFWLQMHLYKYDMDKASSDVNFYIRFILASPLVFYITFCSIQYKQIRNLINKYSFKTTLAASIKSHLELLTTNEKFVDATHVKDILKFTLDAFGQIYREPDNNEELKLKLKIQTAELNFEKSSEIKAKIEALEDNLKKLSPN